MLVHPNPFPGFPLVFRLLPPPLSPVLCFSPIMCSKPSTALDCWSPYCTCTGSFCFCIALPGTAACPPAQGAYWQVPQPPRGAVRQVDAVGASPRPHVCGRSRDRIAVVLLVAHKAGPPPAPRCMIPTPPPQRVPAHALPSHRLRSAAPAAAPLSPPSPPPPPPSPSGPTRTGGGSAHPSTTRL